MAWSRSLPDAPAVPRLLRLPEVMQRTGLKEHTLYRLMRQGMFPVPLKISRRNVAWRDTDVQVWLEPRNRLGNGLNEEKPRPACD